MSAIIVVQEIFIWSLLLCGGSRPYPSKILLENTDCLDVLSLAA